MALYEYVAIWDPCDPPNCNLVFLDVPLSLSGSDPDNVIRRGRTLLQEYLGGFAYNGQSIPKPTNRGILEDEVVYDINPDRIIPVAPWQTLEDARNARYLEDR